MIINNHLAAFILLVLVLMLTACPKASESGGNVDNGKNSIEDTLKLRGEDTVVGDLFGGAVAASGNTIVIGAPGVSDSKTVLDTGAVYVMTRNGKTWGAENIKLTASDAKPKDGFGEAVAISGNTIIVGVPKADDNGESSGAAYIFRREGSSWVQETKLTPSDAAPEEQFGRDVAIDGDVAIVGMWKDPDNIFDVPGSLLDESYGQGSVYVFENQGGAWLEQVRLIPSELRKNGVSDGFGNTVAIHGDYLAVGAENTNVNDIEDAGAVYIFKRSGAAWLEQAQLSASDAVKEGHFGNDVALYGDYLVVGAPGEFNRFLDNFPDNDFGAAYIFKRSGELWLEQAKLEPNEQELNDDFATSVSIHADRVLVGAPLSDENLTDQGSAFLYRRSGSSWLQEAEYIAKDGLIEELFGGPIALGDDYAIIGAPRQCHATGCSAGAVYIFSGDAKSDPPPTGTGRLIVTISGLPSGVSADVSVTSTASFSQNLTASSTLTNLASGTYQVVARNISIAGESYDPTPTSRNLTINDGKTETATATVSYVKAANVPPSISSIENQITSQLTVLELDFSITDEVSDSVMVTASSRNQNIIPDSNLVVSGTGQARHLSITPVSTESGNLTINLSATDGAGLSSQTSFELEVTEPYRTELTGFANDVSVAANFGYAVAISEGGDFLVVGAPATLLDSQPGAVYVLKRLDGSTWTEDTKFSGSDVTGGSKLGYSLDISTDEFIVGAPEDDNGVKDSGSAYIFKHVSNEWIEVLELTASDIAKEDKFGTAVAIDGDYAVVTAPYNDDKGENAGAVYVFKRNGKTWAEQVKLTASDGSTGDLLGGSIALDGNTFVVGAKEKAASADKQGVAYVFKRSGDTWTEEMKLTSSDGAENDNFGASVAIEGNTIVVSATGYFIFGFEHFGNPVGKTYVFERSGSIWEEKELLEPIDAEDDAKFGSDVAIYENYLLVGARSEGTAFLFKLSGDTWVEDLKIFPKGNFMADFGSTLALSQDYAVIGSPLQNVGQSCSLLLCERAGAIYIYK